MTAAVDTAIPVQHFVRIEEKITKADDEALRQRWQFGKDLLPYREDRPNGVRSLPHGELVKLSEECRISKAELSNRMQFAEEYRITEVANALDTYGSWHGICREGLGKRKPVKRSDPVDRKQRRIEGLPDKTWDAVKDKAEQFGESPGIYAAKVLAKDVEKPVPEKITSEEKRANPAPTVDDCGVDNSFKDLYDTIKHWLDSAVRTTKDYPEERAKLRRLLKTTLNNLEGK